MKRLDITLGQLVRRRRLELELTQEELSERISGENEFLRQSDISQLERGEIQPPAVSGSSD